MKLFGTVSALALAMCAAACSIQEPGQAEENVQAAAKSADAGSSDAKSPPPAKSKSDSGAESEPEPEAEPKGEGEPAPAPAPKRCTVTFEKDVLPSLASAGCSNLACHGTRFAPAVRMEAGDPTRTYEALTSYVINGKPYVKAKSTDPNDSSMFCHLSGRCGRKMPPTGGEIPTDLVEKTTAWLSCGAPR